ncbi:efflux RND transporter periplasmic adaptor subunit [Rudanella lutea]|uniref:efflux RND transporter periplasmic adaptor subunit n=1 Tax=Rudanella lutea TaxID=451374 RepID=UPI0003819D6D|nr:efflux RND transporter periplasmic adaptor subunit [Rudanella lutea]
MNYIAIALILTLPFACKPKTESGESTDKPTTEATAQTPADSAEAPSDEVLLTADQIRLAGIATGLVEYRNLSQTLALNGRVVASAQNRVSISALQGGFVRQITLLPGQRVRKGQVLARVENPDLIQVQQDYAENRARLTYLEAEYARQQELSRENVGALKVFQQTSSDLNATRARLSALALRIRRLGLSPESATKGQFTSTYTVSSPVNGVVTEVPANLGQYVQPADVLAQLVGTDQLFAELTVFEKDLPLVREGQRVRVRLAGAGRGEQTARIYLINRSIDTDRSVRVLARFEGGSAAATMPPNAFLQAVVELGANRSPALPEGAIVSSEGKEYIFVAQAPHGNNTSYKALPIRRGVTEDGYSGVVLPAGFDPAQTPVVVKGAYAILSQWKGGGEEE